MKYYAVNKRKKLHDGQKQLQTETGGKTWLEKFIREERDKWPENTNKCLTSEESGKYTFIP